MDHYKVLLPRRDAEKPVQIFCNNRQVAMNEARELSCRNSARSVEIYILQETLIDTVSCSKLEEGLEKNNVVEVVNQTTKDKNG